jgi:hypothetical protein
MSPKLVEGSQFVGIRIASHPTKTTDGVLSMEIGAR